MEYRAILFNSARDGNLKRLQVFLDNQHDPEWLEKCLNSENNDKLPLVAAARYGHLEVVKYLISKGAQPDRRGSVAFDGETIYKAPALWAAAAAGHLDIVSWLMEETTADKDQPTSTNSTPLRGACYDGHIHIVKYLVEHGANMDTTNSHGHSPLMIAAFRGKLDVVDYLLSKGASFTGKSKKGNTALHDAAEGDFAQVCESLLKAGAALEDDDQGMCPLMCAALLGHDKVIQVLMPACSSAKKRRDVLKILGCTRVDKMMDIRGACTSWRESFDQKLSIEERLEEERNGPWTVPAVYRVENEVSSHEDVDLIEHNPDAIKMQSLLIRERILGSGHHDVHYYLRFRGAVFCDLGRMDRCFELWNHSLVLQQMNLSPLHISTVATFQAFQETFGLSLNEHVNNHDMDRRNWPVKPELVMDIFSKLCDELVRIVEWGNRPLFTECCGASEDHLHDKRTEVERLVLIGLQLLHQLNRLSSPLHTPEQIEEEQESQSTEDGNKIKAVNIAGHETEVDELMKVFLWACSRLRMSPLHLALQEHAHTESSGQLPSVYVVKLLLKAGATRQINKIDAAGNTPLHVLLLNLRPRLSIVRLLLDNGAEIFSRNYDDCTCMDLIPMAQLTDKLNIMKYVTLKGLAANQLRQSRKVADIRQYTYYLPADLGKFYILH